MAYDKASGTELASIDLPAGAIGTPMTYMVDGRQDIALAVGGGPRLVALALPESVHREYRRRRTRPQGLPDFRSGGGPRNQIAGQRHPPRYRASSRRAVLSMPTMEWFPSWQANS